MTRAILSASFLTAVLSTVFCASRALADDNLTSFHMQSTVVSQSHTEFPAAYSGLNSLSSSADSATSITWTIFGGVHLWKGGELYLNPELSGGSGFNGTKGLAGFPNGEIYRVDDAAPKWSLARLFYKQVFGSGETEKVSDAKNQIETVQPVQRFTVILGRFSLNDYFDNNTYSHDPRTQFLNWALMDNAAWDYAADTRGYSWGFFLEYNEASWTFRFASVMVPTAANQLQLETNFPQFFGDNLEFESRYKWSGRPGAYRFLLYDNHADMGNYQSTVENPAYGMDITQSRSPSFKIGAGVSIEQEIANNLGAFARASWNDGHTETWAFTEVDRAVSVGLSASGKMWKRPDDNAGLALLGNGLSPWHRDYLAAGGYGFIVGDGHLNYGPELIGETYYLFKMMPGFDLSGDYQFVKNPAYNMDRGPVSIFAVRVHYEI